MQFNVEDYRCRGADRIPTPALLFYSDPIRANIDAGINLAGGVPGRWRPHVKTFKCAEIVRMLIGSGVRAFKCATTGELRMCCEARARDVLFAMPAVGAVAARVAEMAREYHAAISVLVESESHLAAIRNSQLWAFIDVNPGMNRTGIAPERAEEIVHLANLAGRTFRGLHFYDGHISCGIMAEREKCAHAGYDRLVAIIDRLAMAGLTAREVITSGTPAAPAAMSYPGFQSAAFVHRISPGTIVLNDVASIDQLPGFGFVPAALVLATVISHPAPGIVTCDAGHKSVSADAGIPTCAVLGRPGLVPLKPSEEHLPIQVAPGEDTPAIGEQLYLLPQHVCPTVNLFDSAYEVMGGEIRSLLAISARGHETVKP